MKRDDFDIETFVTKAEAAMTALRTSLTIAAALLLGLAAAGCDKPAGPASAQAPGNQPPPEVTVARPVQRQVSERAEHVGRFVAVETVELRARVSGYLEEVHFRDGQTVDKGDLLFSIDKRPFAVALDQAKANLDQARANLAFAVSNLERGRSLQRGTVISEQTLDERKQAQAVAQSSVSAQQAAVRQAELDLAYTELRAPVAGRIGDRRVSPGNLVTGGSGGSTTLLATIQSVDPIRFEFTIDEASYLRFLKNYGEGAAARPDAPVELKLIDEEAYAHRGRLDFVDNTISRSAGVIRMRATFPNPSGKLTPGMFGRLRIELSPPAQALLVPDAAIGTEQVRKFVMVVAEKDGKQVAQPKYVTLGPLSDGLRVIRSGLAADDRVIINGLMRARPGTPVTAKDGVITTAQKDAGATTR